MPTFAINGQTLHYEDVPCAKDTGLAPVLFFHSFMCDSSMFQHQFPVVSQTRRCVAVDLPGHGKSGSSVRYHDLYAMVDEGIALLDHLGIGRFIVYGQSIGGMVAMRAAIRYPDRVLGAVLADTSATRETLFQQAKFTLLARIIEWTTLTPFLTALAELEFGRTAMRERKALVDEFKMRVRGMKLSDLVTTKDTLLKRDSVLDQLSSINMPSLVMYGDEAVPYNRREHDALHKAIAGSKLEVIARAGHVCSYECPEQVNPIIESFLARITD